MPIDAVDVVATASPRPIVFVYWVATSTSRSKRDPEFGWNGVPESARHAR
jgi:hypothetical protein